MINAIAAHSPGKSSAKLRRGLKREERARILEVVAPEYSGNPFKSNFVKHRNQLICHLLFNFGPRRAETLLIKKEDIEWNLGDDPTLNFRDHPFDSTDTRRVQPQFKTKERQLPLGRNLARLIANFSKNYRNKIPGAKSHGYLLVARNGAPLSISSLNSIFEELSFLDGLPSELSAHLLRYTWNDMFSEIADRKIASGKWTVEDEKRVRRWHQGWSDDSTMPDKYCRRHIEEKAKAVSKEMQEEIMNDFLIIDPANLPK